MTPASEGWIECRELKGLEEYISWVQTGHDFLRYFPCLMGVIRILFVRVCLLDDFGEDQMKND